MTVTDRTEQLRLVLEGQQSLIEERIAKIQEAEREETSGGQTDNAHEWENAEVRSGLLDSAMEELRGVQTALERLARGEYGTCARCGKDIGIERLKALPSADLCIDCAERTE